MSLSKYGKDFRNIAPQYDIEIYENSLWKKTFQYLDQDDDPIDITGYGADVYIIEELGLDIKQNLVHLTVGSGIELFPAVGTFEVTFNANQVNNLGIRSGYWLFYIYSDSGQKETLNQLFTWGEVSYIRG